MSKVFSGEKRPRRSETSLEPGQQARRTVYWGLTAMEIRALSLASVGLTVEEMAESVGVSRNTIKAQLLSAYTKMGTRNRVSAVVDALRAGVIPWPPLDPATWDVEEEDSG